jgi:hypothetical protein
MTDPRLLTDAIVGYRAFTVRDGGRLHSQYSGVEWPSFPDVTFEARCEVGRYAGFQTFTYLKPAGESKALELEHEPRLDEHVSPHPDCACGIHGFYDVGSVADATVPWEGGEAIVGLIAGWGEVIPHPDGFRCSRARICALSGTSSEARAAAANCEVRLVARRAELVDLAHLFGRPMPEQLIPAAIDPGPAARYVDHVVRIAT